MKRQAIVGLLTAAVSATALVGAPVSTASANILHCIDEGVGGDATPHYNQTFTGPRPALSATALNGYVPQGLTTWKNYYGANHDLLVYTAYKNIDGAGRAVIQGIDQRDGSLTNYAVIGRGHVGGVAIYGKWAFVSGEGNTVRRYQLSKLADVFAGRSTTPLAGAKAGDVYAASFLANDGNVLYAGRFSGDANDGTAHRDKMYRYRISATGTLSRIGSAADWVEVPAKTQGLLVLGKNFVFSTSEDRNNRSNLYVVRRGNKTLDQADDRGQLGCVRAPSMTEGLALSQDRIYVLYESGAAKYANASNKPDRIIKRLHSAQRVDLLRLLG